MPKGKDDIELIAGGPSEEKKVDKPKQVAKPVAAKPTTDPKPVLGKPLVKKPQSSTENELNFKPIEASKKPVVKPITKPSKPSAVGSLSKQQSIVENVDSSDIIDMALRSRTENKNVPLTTAEA